MQLVKLTGKISEVGGLWMCKDDLETYGQRQTDGEKNMKMKDAIICQEKKKEI